MVRMMILLSAGTLTATAPVVVHAQQRAIAYDIAAQPLNEALNDWARASGRQILFPFEAVAGRRSVALRASLPPREALDRIIGDARIMVVGDDGTTVTLRAMPQSAAVPEELLPSDDIVVTAQRRRERQGDVPVSLTAIGARTIENARLNELRDVSRVTPGLLVSNFSLGAPVIAIRGATNTFNQIGVDKPVGIIVDDVFVPRNSAATFQLFGLDSIQVLRGPQGTLFGKNVTGGVIIFDTGRPEYETQEARIRASFGSFRAVELDALADIAIGPDVAARVAGAVRRRDGWGSDRLTGQELDNLDSANLRGQLRFRLGDSGEVLLAGDYASDRSGGRTLSSLTLGNDGDPRTAESGTPQRFDREVGGVSARLFIDTAFGELTSITAWRGSRSTDIYSNVAANFRFLVGTQSQALTDDRDRVSTFSSELRLASPEWDAGRFLLGAYVATDGSTRTLTSTALARTGALVTDNRWTGRVDSQTYALFADGSLNIAPFLAVTAGVRQTWDRKSADLTFANRRTGVGNFSATNARSAWSEFTPRASVQLTPIEDLLVYAAYSRGYTAGGYNTQAATLAAFTAAFEPETLENFEGGVKSALFDGRLRFSANIFRMNYRDKQELFFNNQTRILNITNAARARIEGAEIEATARPLSWLSLNGTYGRLDTRYESFIIPGGATLTGNRLGSSPKDKWSAMVDIDAPVGNVRIVGNFLYSYTSQYFTGATNDATLQVEGYGLSNAQIGLATLDNRFRITLFARNLFDNDYVLIPSNQVVLGQYLGEPRTIGVSFGGRF